MALVAIELFVMSVPAMILIWRYTPSKILDSPSLLTTCMASVVALASGLWARPTSQAYVYFLIAFFFALASCWRYKFGAAPAQHFYFLTWGLLVSLVILFTGICMILIGIGYSSDEYNTSAIGGLSLDSTEVLCVTCVLFSLVFNLVVRHERRKTPRTDKVSLTKMPKLSVSLFPMPFPVKATRMDFHNVQCRNGEVNSRYDSMKALRSMEDWVKGGSYGSRRQT